MFEKKTITRLSLATLGALTCVVARTQQQPSPNVTVLPLARSLTAAQPIPTGYPVDPRATALMSRFGSLVAAARAQADAAGPVSAPVPRALDGGAARPGGTSGAKTRSAFSRGVAVAQPTPAPSLFEAQMRPGGTLRALRARGGGVLQTAVAGNDAAGRLETVRSFFRTRRTLLGLADPEAELVPKSSFIGSLGMTHLRFEQRFRNLPVWKSELIARLDKSGNLVAVDGAYAPTPTKVPSQPVLDAAQGAATARVAHDLSAAELLAPPRLVIYTDEGRPARLAWEVKLGDSPADRWSVLVDASTGAILTSVSLVQSQSIAGTGLDLHGVQQPLNVWLDNGTYSMIDTSKQMFNPALDPMLPDPASGTLFIADRANTTDSLFYVQSNQANGPWLADGVSAALNLSAAYDYYLSHYGRNSLDGLGSSLFAYVRFDVGYRNAYFDGSTQTMTFGDGEPFAGALDVVAHELTHGVVDNTAGLIYQDQSGALNEALADIFGEMTEASVNGAPDWLIGTDLSSPFRSMENPELFGDPSRMSDFLVTTQDSGGVHTNSGIINHAYYLLAEGLPNAIGIADAERIFYRALTTMLVARSEFVDARIACIQAAEDLFGVGSPQAVRTEEAFDAVEIFDVPTNPSPGPVPPVSGDDSTLFVFYDQGSGSDYLGRREDALGDPSQGVFLSGAGVVRAQPSVSGDGELGVYVDATNDLCLILTSTPSSEQCTGFPGLIHSVAMAPDGNSFAVTFIDPQGKVENEINILDIGSGTTQTIPLVAPTPDGDFSIQVLEADAMDFSSDVRYLFYDAFNQIDYANGSSVGSWSIYGYDLTTGATFSLVSPVYGFDIGYPNIGQTNDFRIVFDARSSSTGQNTVYAADLLTGAIATVASTQDFSEPVYTGDDAGIVFSEVDGGAPTGASLYLQPMSSDGITPSGSSTLWLQDADFATVYRRGVFSPSAAVDLNVSGTLAPTVATTGASVTLDFTVTNQGPDDASGVTLTIVVPQGADALAGSPECALAGNQLEITCDFQSIAASAQATASFSFVAQQRGKMTFALSAIAQENDSDTSNNASFAQLTVANQAPTVLVSPTNGTVTAGNFYSQNVAPGFSDPEGDALTFTASGLPTSLSISSSGMISGTVTNSDVRSTPYVVSVTATDSFGDSVNSSFTLTVSAPPPPPSSGGGGGGAAGLFMLLLLLVPSVVRYRPWWRGPPKWSRKAARSV